MKSFLCHATVVSSVLLLLPLASFGDTILAQWTFETSIPTTAGPHAAEAGTGDALGLHASASTVYSNPAGNGSPESFSSNFWASGDYYQFSTSSIGYQDIKLSWDQTGSSTGPRDFKLAYSTDNSTYTDFSSYEVLNNGAPNSAWSAGTNQPVFTFTKDLSAESSLDNDATIYFRLINTSAIAINGGAVGTAGTGRVDNFTITGIKQVEPVPEPWSFASAGMMSLVGLLAGLRHWRKNSVA